MQTTIKEPSNPHDAFFKQLLENPALAAEIIKAVLPDKIYAQIDISELILIKDSFTIKGRGLRFADVIYQAMWVNKKELLITFLFEHKSYKDTHVPLQLLQYMVSVWQQQLKQQKQLTVIIPIVFYHGATQWQIPQFADYFTGLPPELRRYIPNFAIEILNLQQKTDAELLNTFQSYQLRSGLYLMKHIFEKEKEHFIVAIRDALEQVLASSVELSESERVNWIDNLINYAEKNPQISDSDLVQIFVSLQQGNKLMTFSQFLIEQGKAEGERIGKAEGERIGKAEGERIGKAEGERIGKAAVKKQVLNRMLAKGLQIDEIIELTGWDKDEIEWLISLEEE